MRVVSCCTDIERSTDTVPQKTGPRSAGVVQVLTHVVGKTRKSRSDIYVYSNPALEFT